MGGILAVAGEPDFLANSEEASYTMDETRREFTELISVLSVQEQGVWTAAELTELSSRHFLLRAELGDGSHRSQTTRMGVLLGRYVGEPFALDDEHIAVFHKSEDGRKSYSHVEATPKTADIGVASGPFRTR